jgi:hypothetical protein
MFLVLPKIAQRADTALRLLLWCTLVLFWFPPVYFVLVAQHSLYLFCPLLLILAAATFGLSRKIQTVEISRQAIGETCSSA